MNGKQFFGMYWALYLIIMFVTFSNAKSFIQAGIIMVLVILIAEVDHRYGFYKEARKLKAIKYSPARKLEDTNSLKRQLRLFYE